MTFHSKFAGVGIIRGAIYTNGFKTTNPYLYGFESQINYIIEHNQNPLDFVNIEVPDTNYVINIGGNRSVLMFVTIHPDEYTRYTTIGTIMYPESKIPDISTSIVVQPCPGIYNAYDWHGVSADLCGVTIDELEPHEFLKRITYVLECIGYMSQTDSVESELLAFEIMDQLKVLFDQANVEHATNHMKTILDLVSQLECVVMKI